MPDSKLITFRRKLHQYPELSGQEYETAKRVAGFLRQLKPDQIWEQIGGTGIVARFAGKDSGPCLLFRAELDALPIQELNSFAYQSKNQGVSHKCGHDGHTTILLGLAAYLSENKLQSGSVLLLFQPAEETGAGAEAMLEDPRWTSIPEPDYVFALHNLPGSPMGQVLIREGAISAAVRSMIIKMQGKTSHAAEPEHGINPTAALVHVLPRLAEISNNDIHREDFKVITPVHVWVGEKAYGVSAGYGELHLTIRSWTEEVMQALIQEIVNTLDEAVRLSGIQYEISWTDTFLGNTNDPEATAMVIEAAKALGCPIIRRATPLKWGEDFGCFTQRYPGAFLGLGAGEDTPALHNPDYDFPDVLIKKGVDLWSALLATFKMI
jgi:amidohydrolase